MELNKVIEKYSAKLRKKKNVVVVGKGRKMVGGVDTGRPAIVVGVSKKLPLSQLRKQDIVPKKVKGCETDVVEVGEIKLLSDDEPPDRKAKWRPAPGGVSIGHYTITAGTLGMVVRKNGLRYILSNNHVLAASNAGQIGDPCYQPGKYDGGQPEDEIAKLSEFIPINVEGQEPSPCPIAGATVRVANAIARALRSKTKLMAVVVPLTGDNLVDCALARPNSDADVLDEILEVGMPDYTIAMPQVGLKVKKSGRTTGLTHGEVNIVDATVDVNMGNGKVATFKDQFLIGPMSQGGDSGSIIVTEDNKLVGLLFAGSDMITVGNKYSNVARALELD